MYLYGQWKIGVSLANSIRILGPIKTLNSFILKAKQLLYVLRNCVNCRLFPLVSLGPINGSQVFSIDTLEEEDDAIGCYAKTLGKATRSSMTPNGTPMEQQTPPTTWATPPHAFPTHPMYSKDEKYNSLRPQLMPLLSRWVESSQEV